MYPPVYQKVRLIYVTDFVQTPDFHNRLQTAALVCFACGEQTALA